MINGGVNNILEERLPLPIDDCQDMNALGTENEATVVLAPEIRRHGPEFVPAGPEGKIPQGLSIACGPSGPRALDQYALCWKMYAFGISSVMGSNRDLCPPFDSSSLLKPRFSTSFS